MTQIDNHRLAVQPTSLLLVFSLFSCLSLSLAADQLPEVTVTVIEAEGFCMNDTSVNNWYGFIPDLVTEIGKEVGFKPIISRVADGRYGRFEEETGRWNGLIGEVISGKADFAAAALTQTSLREEHIDFSHEILDVGLVILTKTPERLHPVTRSASFFLSVFDFSAWMGATIVLLLAWLLIFLNSRYNPREQRNRIGERSAGGVDYSTEEFSLINTLFFVISTGCFQGFRQSPQSLAGRCLCILWWLFVMVLATTYVAGILCGLVASRGSLDRRLPSVDPREQFGSNSGSFDSFVPVWLSHGSTNMLMKNSRDPFLHHLYVLNQKHSKVDSSINQVTTIPKLIELIEQDNKYLGILESDLAYLYSRRSDCKLSVVSPLLTDRSYAFAFPENSTWIRKVNTAILKLREDGFISASYDRHFGSSIGRCNFNAGPAETLAMSLVGQEIARMFKDSVPITIGTLMGPIFMFCLGLVLAAAAAAADVFIYTRHERYQGNQPFRSVHSASEPPFGGINFDEHAADEPTM